LIERWCPALFGHGRGFDIEIAERRLRDRDAACDRQGRTQRQAEPRLFGSSRIQFLSLVMQSA
jgi:hypothetical protein